MDTGEMGCVCGWVHVGVANIYMYKGREKQNIHKSIHQEWEKEGRGNRGRADRDRQRDERSER